MLNSGDKQWRDGGASSNCHGCFRCEQRVGCLGNTEPGNLHNSGSDRYVQSWQRAGGKHRGHWNYRDPVSDGDQQSQPASARREWPGDSIGKSCQRNSSSVTTTVTAPPPPPPPPNPTPSPTPAPALQDPGPSPTPTPVSNTNARESDSGTFTINPTPTPVAGTSEIYCPITLELSGRARGWSSDGTITWQVKNSSVRCDANGVVLRQHLPTGATIQSMTDSSGGTCTQSRTIMKRDPCGMPGRHTLSLARVGPSS